MTNEQQLINRANRIKAEQGLTLSQIAIDINDDLGRLRPYSTAYISNALNLNDDKTNGVNISAAIIEHYTETRFIKDESGKLATFFQSVEPELKTA